MGWRSHALVLLAVVGLCAGMWVVFYPATMETISIVNKNRSAPGRQWRNGVRVAVVWPQRLEGASKFNPSTSRLPWLANRLPRGPIAQAFIRLREVPLPSYPEGLRVALNILREKEILQNLTPLADRIELVRYYEPSFPLAEDAASLADQVIQDKSVVAVVGHYSSPSAIEASIVYEKHRVLFITPTATVPELTKRGFYYTFRLTPDDGDLALTIAMFAKQRGYAKVGVLYPRTQQGESLKKRLTAKARITGLEVVFTTSYFGDPSEWNDMDDYRPLAAKIRRSGVEAILVADELPRAAKLIMDLRSMQVMQPILGSDYMDSPSLIELAGVAAQNVYVTSAVDPNTNTAAYIAFKERYLKMFGILPSYAASQGFETMQLLYTAIRLANSAEPLALANRFRTVDSWPSMFDPFRFSEEGTIECRSISVKVTEVAQMRFSSLVTPGPKGTRLPFSFEPKGRSLTACP